MTCMAPTLPWIVTLRSSFVNFGCNSVAGVIPIVFLNDAMSGTVFGLRSCGVAISENWPWNDDDFSLSDLPLRFFSSWTTLRWVLFGLGIFRKYNIDSGTEAKIRTSATIGWVWWVAITSLPQAPVSEEPEARKAESWGRALALKLAVIDNYHNRNNQKTAEGKSEISMEYLWRELRK